ncbi:hypothetical protein COU00_03675 [Candidatus Falkowbacteria bacterium CG10_big_fil_rev_8_21_14_0_10_43_11]|uniref:Uncharacterized protein n=1 Tax=Candidatus Falkowbacteria bacterium CG10_big_fil_rev_8_21_14_0_10_43_11 TaxID=1974568 RepID=A0A2M6WLG7_9BACT|nr:MAG: hypothetical protein COU00_03675 [Candidatus Falkowbacteria bacterium CG10_big_fil_rev_8_21_14_0_10_43_11]
MPNPNLTTKQAAALTLSDAAKDLFRAVYQEQQQAQAKKDDETAKIKVNDIISKMSFFYEKIRNAVDYKDDHLLRKNAIERILKRLSMMGHTESEEIAKTLLVELIRAGYLANDSVPETKIAETGEIIERFAKLRQLILAAGKKDYQEADETKKWINNLTATNLEELLGDHQADQVIGRHMFDVINGNILDNGADKDFTRDKKIQIYVGIYGKLFKYDDAMLEYMLFRYFNPQWGQAEDEQVAVIARHYLELRDIIRRQLRHYFRKQVGRVVGRYTIYFSVLKDAIAEDPAAAYDKLKERPDQFKKIIAKVCERRYKESRDRLRRGAVRSIIYLFLTKTILVFILEIPATLFLGEEIKSYSLIVNVLFPPALLFLIALMTSLPDDANTAQIQAGIEEIVFVEKKEKHPIKINYPTKRKAATSLIFGFFYTATFLLSFGLVVWALEKIDFSLVSVVIFLFFLSLISFFGIRLGRFAKAYSVMDARENILSFFANFFYVPIVAMGKWLSETFSQINVFIFILDFIIEAPFKIFVEMFEQWTAYVKERKEGIVE